MRQLFATFTRFMALLLFPLFFGLSAQAAAVDVFTSCADPQAQQTDVCQMLRITVPRGQRQSYNRSD